jgi:hypothetical protein
MEDLNVRPGVLGQEEQLGHIVREHGCFVLVEYYLVLRIYLKQVIGLF